jgi:hypothetical protein
MQTKQYFAAANGYDGFISYFDMIFNPSDFTRIYILKGGPGTGKSSLMRKISGMAKSRGAVCESILCSSDKDSLDGIICENGDRRIAILDGTAPHERDTAVPGAVDEIVNLGENWDKRWLESRRSEISDLNTEKKTAYATAYSYLRMAGCASREARKFVLNEKIAKNVKSAANSLAEDLKYSRGDKKVRLISSFGKQGHYRLDTLEEAAKKRYTLIGDKAIKSIFMNQVSDTLSLRSADLTVSPSALEKDDTDALFIGGEDISISRISGGEVIDLGEFYVSDALTDERTRTMRDIEASALESAKRWFKIASDLHFRLEEIYKTSMNFDQNEQIIVEKSEEISKILGL